MQNINGVTKRNNIPTYPLIGSMTVAPSYSSPASIFWDGKIKSCNFD